MYNDLTDAKQAIVRGVAKEKFLAVLFLERSDVKSLQLKDNVKNYHAKGVRDAFQSQPNRLCNSWQTTAQ